MKIPEDKIRFSLKIQAGENWSHVLKRGTTLQLHDIEGGANISMMLYNFEILSERYNMPDTLKAQHTAYLTKGHCLYSDMGRILASITEDSCGWHDTISGYSTPEIIEKKYGTGTFQELRNKFHRNAYHGFLQELAKYDMGPRDLIPCVNFFSKVTNDLHGNLSYVPNHSKSGSIVHLRSEMNTLIILNTCPHPLDTSPTYNAKKIEATIWTSPLIESDDACRTSCPENERGFINTERYFL
ncbi:MAG: urea amidolyase associated protein UAAP1 [Verrucomicrobiota bacterium]